MQNGDNPQPSATTTPEPSPTAPQSSPAGAGALSAAPSLFSSLDAIGRSTATVVVVVYAFGFVILGFYDAQYGVAQFSPFRARIILVGFVFVMLVSLAAAAQHYGLTHMPSLEPVLKDSKPRHSTYRDVILASGFIYTAMIMSVVLGSFLFHGPFVEEKTNRWQTIAGIGFPLLGFLLFYPIAKIYLKRPGLASFLSLIAFGIIVAAISMEHGPFPYLTLMLAMVGMIAVHVKRESNPLTFALKYSNWPFILAILWVYITQIFGAVPPRWGGGQSVPVQILQNTPAPWLGSNPVDVLLLDETDQGLYVLLSPGGRAYFVPRSNVASMFFGTKDELSKKP